MYKIAFSLVKSFRWYGPRESLPSSFVCLRGHEFLLVSMRSEFKIIIPKSVQHIIFVGVLFQIEISDGLVHPLGSRQNVSLCPAMVITGAGVFRSLYAFRVQKDHSDDCTSLLVKYFKSRLQMVSSIPLGVVKM